MRPRFAPAALAVGMVAVVAMAVFLLFEVRALEERLARLEAYARARMPGSRAAERRAPEPKGSGGRSVVEAAGRPAAAAAAPGGPTDEALREDVRQMSEALTELQARLGDVTQRATTLEQQEAARRAARRATEEQAKAAATAMAQDDVKAQEAAVGAQAAATLAWLEAELEKVAEDLSLTDAQSERAQTLLRELTDKYFPNDRPAEEAWKDWAKFQTEWNEGVKGLMTSEQRGRYAEYQQKQVQEQVSTSASYTVATMTRALGLDEVQRDRVKAKVREYYGRMYETYDADPSAATSAYDPHELKEILRGELSAEQMTKFDDWYEATMLAGQEEEGE